jgi:hypothetical protein
MIFLMVITILFFPHVLEFYIYIYIYIYIYNYNNRGQILVLLRLGIPSVD